jgi:SHS2 domain-containing protein
MEPPSFQAIGDDLGFLQIPTTADVGIFSFSRSFEELVDQTAQGMMSIMAVGNELEQSILHHGTWSSTFDAEIDDDMILIRWLDEVLFRREIHQQWYLNGNISIKKTSKHSILFADVVYADSSNYMPETEIKAVTSHQCFTKYIQEEESYFHTEESIPEIAGPCWIAQVIFDI